MIPLPASAGEMGSLARAYVVEIPDAVIRAMDLRPAMLGHPGPGVVGPLGILSGMVFFAVTRASYTVRVKWFESIDWSRMSRVSRGLASAPPKLKVSD